MNNTACEFLMKDSVTDAIKYVMTPTGQQSKLFPLIKEYYNDDTTKAIFFYQILESNEFRQKYGDWYELAKRKAVYFKSKHSFIDDKYKNKIIDNVLNIQISKAAYEELINVNGVDSTEIKDIDNNAFTITFSEVLNDVNDNYVAGDLETVIDTVFSLYNANELKNKLLPEIILNTIELVSIDSNIYELSYDSIKPIMDLPEYDGIRNYKAIETQVNIETLTTDLKAKFQSIADVNNEINRLKTNNPKAVEELEDVKLIFTAKLYNSILGISDNEYEGSSQKRINAIVKDYFYNYGTLHTKELLDLFYVDDTSANLNSDMLIAIHNEIYSDLKNKFDMNILNLQEVDKTDEVDGDDFDENESVETREKHGADKEQLKEQGYQYVSKAIRAFIDLTTFITDEIVYDGIDYNNDFANNAKRIVKREKMINGESVFRILQNMMSKQYHSKLNQDFDTLFQIAAFDNPQVNALYGKYLTAIEVNSNIREALIKELDSIAHSHITLLIDPNIRKSKMFNSNLKNYDTQQVESWNTNWQMFLKEVETLPKAFGGVTENKRQNFVNERVKVIKKIQNKLEEYKTITYFEDMSDLDAKVNVFTDLESDLNIEQATGIKLSKTFIKYSIIQYAINYSKNNVEYDNLGSIYKTLIEDVNLETHFGKPMMDLILTPTFFDEFNRVVGNEEFDYNPYSSSYQKQDILLGNKKKKANSEVTTRLKNIALANSLLDENILQSSFQNAAQDTLFDFSKPSFLSRHAKLLSDKAYRELVKQGNDGAYLGTAIIGGNVLLNLPPEVQDAVMNDFKIHNVSNVTQSVMDNSVVEGDIPDGADFKDITAKVFTVSGLAYFADRNKYRAKVNTNSINSEYIPRYFLRPYILETSNSSHGVTVPVGLPTINNGNLEILNFTSYENKKAIITDTAVDLILNKVKNEYAKMQERKEAIFNGLVEVVEADLAYANNEPVKVPTIHLYEGYDLSIKDGEISFGKAKAFKFFLTRAFFNETKSAAIKGLLSEFKAHINEFENNTKAYYKELKTAKTNVELQAIKAKYDKSKVVNEMSFLETEESKKLFKTEYKNYLINSFNTWVDNALVKEKLVNKNLQTGELTNIMLIETVDIIGTFNEAANIIDTDYKGDLKYFALDFYVNSTIWSMDINELMGDDQSIRKDGTDMNKRIKGGNPGGTPIATGKQKVAIIPEAQYQHLIFGKIDHADAQSYSNMQMFRELTRNQGRYTKKVQKVLQKVTIGLPITHRERMTLENAKAVPNSLKDVYYNVNTFHKDSVGFLLPELTSYIPTYNDAEFNKLAEEIQKLEDTEFMSVNPTLQLAIDRYDKNPDNEYSYFDKDALIKELYTQLYKLSLPRHQYLHDLRMNMFKDDIKVVLPPTATKLLSPIRLDVVNNQTDWNIKDDFRLNFSSYEIDGTYWKEVVEVNTGKKTITYFSQIMRLIEGGHTNEQAIVLGQDGTYYEVSELLNDYRHTMGLMRIKSFADAVSMLVEDEDGNYTNESIKDFNKKIELTLKNSASDNLTLELFGNLTIDKNIPVTVDKYMQLFLSHFDKGVLTQKATGGKYSLFSDAGVFAKVRIDPKTGNELGVITTMELEEIRKADLQALKSNPNHISEYDRIMSATTELVDSVEMEEYEEEVEEITYVPEEFDDEIEVDVVNNEVKTAESIYNELGDKTVSENVVIGFNNDNDNLIESDYENVGLTYDEIWKYGKTTYTFWKTGGVLTGGITSNGADLGYGDKATNTYNDVTTKGTFINYDNVKFDKENWEQYKEFRGGRDLSFLNYKNVKGTLKGIDANNPIELYVDGSDIKSTGAIGFGVNTTIDNKDYSISGAFDTNNLTALAKDLGISITNNPSNVVMEFYGSLVAIRNTPKDRFITIKQDLEGVQLFILSGLLEKLSGKTFTSKTQYDNWYKKLKESEKANYFREVGYIINLDNDLINKFNWDGRKGFYAEDPNVKAVQTKIIDLILERTGKITYKWVKGHSGDIGNEKVDTVAKNRENFNTYKELFTEKSNNIVKQSERVYTYKGFLDKEIPAFKKANPNGVIAFRTKVNDYLKAYQEDNAIGNPFSHSDKALIQNVGSVDKAVKMFIMWITGDIKVLDYLSDKQKADLATLKPYRQAVYKDLKAGKFKGNKILYYLELKEPSHATALDYLINKYDWNNTTTKVPKKRPKYTNYVNSQPDIKLRRLRASRPVLSTDFVFKVNDSTIKYSKDEIIDNLVNNHNLIKDSSEYEDLLQFFQYIDDLNNNVEIEDYGITFAKFEKVKNNASNTDDRNVRELLNLAYENIKTTITQDYKDSYNTNNVIIKDLVKISDVTKQGYFEILLSRWDDFQYDITSEEFKNKVVQETMKFFGGRIPSQEYHSMIAAKVVDFLPSAMGDVAIAAREIVPLSGADFDIDSIYGIRKASASLKGLSVNSEVFNIYHEFGQDTLTDEDTLAIKAHELMSKRYEQLFVKKSSDETYLKYLAANRTYKIAVLTSDFSKESRVKIGQAKNDRDDLLSQLQDENKEYLLLSNKQLLKSTDLKALSDLSYDELNEQLTDELIDDYRREIYYNLYVETYKKKHPRIKAEIAAMKMENSYVTELESRLAELEERFEVVNNNIKRYSNKISEAFKTRGKTLREASSLLNILDNEFSSNTLILSEMYNIKNTLKDFNDEIIEKVFTSNGLPTKNNFTQSANPLSMHNRLVDSNFNLFNDPTLVKIAVYDDATPDRKMDIGVTQSPAVMSKIQGSDSARNNDGKLINLVSLSKMFPKMRGALSIDDYDPFTPLGLYIAYKSNRVSSKMIGPAALAKIVKSKGGNIFTRTVDFNWDNKAYKKGLSATISHDVEFEQIITTDEYGNETYSYQIKVYQDSNRVKSPIVFRIDDELSTMISVMTDAPKWNDPYKLQLSFETLGTYLYLISIGVGINRAMLLAQMSFIQILDTSTNESNHQIVLNEELYQTKGVKLLLGSPKFDNNGKITNGIFTAAAIMIRDTLNYITLDNKISPALQKTLKINDLRSNLEINKKYYENLNTHEYNVAENIFEATGFVPNPKKSYIFNTSDVSFNLITNKELYTALDSKELFDAVSTRELVKYFTGGYSSPTEGLNLELQDLDPKMILNLIYRASELLYKNLNTDRFIAIYDNYQRLAKLIDTNFKAVMFYQATFQVSNEMLNFITLLQVDKGIKPSFGEIDKILKSMKKLGIKVVYLTKDEVNELRGYSNAISEQRENELLALAEEFAVEEDIEDADVIDDGLSEELAMETKTNEKRNQAGINSNDDIYEYVEFTYDVFKDNEGRNYYLAINKDAKTIVDYSKIIEDPMIQTNLVAIHKIANEISPKLILNRKTDIRSLIEDVTNDLKIGKENDYEYLEKTMMTYITSKMLKKEKEGLEFRADLLYDFYNMEFDVETIMNNGEIASYVLTELPKTASTLYDKYLRAAISNSVIGNLLLTKLITSPEYNNDTNTSPIRFGIESFITKSDAINAQLKTDLLTIKQVDKELYDNIVAYLFSKDGLNLGKDSVIKYMDNDVFKKLSKVITTLRLSTTEEFNELLDIDNLPDDFLSIFVTTNKGIKLLQSVKIKVKAKEDLLSSAGIEIIDSLQLSRGETLNNQFVIINADTTAKERSLVNNFGFKIVNDKLPRYFKTSAKVDNKTVTTVYRKIIEFINVSVYAEIPEYTITKDINPFVFNDSSEIANLQQILNDKIVKNSISGVLKKSIDDLKASLLANEASAPIKMYEQASKYLLRPVYKSFERTYLTSKEVKAYLRKIGNNEIDDEYVKQTVINKIKARLIELTTIKNKNSEFKVANYEIEKQYNVISATDFEGFTFTEDKLEIINLVKKGNMITFMNENTYNKLSEHNKTFILFNAKSVILQRDKTYTYIDSNNSFDVTDSIKGLPLEFATIGANVNVRALVALIDKSKLFTIQQLEYNNTTFNLNKTSITSANNAIEHNTLSDLGKFLLDAANKRDTKPVKSLTQLMSLIGGQYFVSINSLPPTAKINLDDKLILDGNHVVQLNSYPFKIVKNKDSITSYVLGNNNNLIDQVLAPKATIFELPLYRYEFNNEVFESLILESLINQKITITKESKKTKTLGYKINDEVEIFAYYGKNADAYIRGLYEYNKTAEVKLDVERTIKQIYYLALKPTVINAINNNGGLEFLNQLSFYGDDTKVKQLKLSILKQVYIEKSMRKDGFIYTSLTKEELSSKTLLNAAESLNTITNAKNSPIYIDVSYIGIKEKGSNVIQELKTDATLISKLNKSRLDIDVINSINEIVNRDTNISNIVKLSALSYAISSRTNTNKSKIVDFFREIFESSMLINAVFAEVNAKDKFDNSIRVPLRDNLLENTMSDLFIVEMSKLAYTILTSKDKADLKENFIDTIYTSAFGMNKKLFENKISFVINALISYNNEFTIKIEKAQLDLKNALNTDDRSVLEQAVFNLILLGQNTYQSYFIQYKDKFKTDIADKIEALSDTMLVDMQKEQYVLSDLVNIYDYATLEEIVLNTNIEQETQAKLAYNEKLLANIDIDKITIVPNCG